LKNSRYYSQLFKQIKYICYFLKKYIICFCEKADVIFLFYFMKKAIIHLVQNFKLIETFYQLELKMFSELNKKYWVYNIIFFKWNLISDKNFLEKYINNWVLVYNYYDNDDLRKKIIKINKDYNILHITTTSEFLINTKNNLLKLIWKKKSINSKIFRDKYIQRDLLQTSNFNLWIKFLKLDINELDFDLIKEKIWLPFILKPTNWVQSAGVIKIENRENFDDYMNHYKIFYKNCSKRGFKSDLILAEEYIDWELYSIDYFVSENQDLLISKPVKVKLAIDLWINDYFNLSRIVTNELEEKFKDKNLEKFVRDTIKATWIKTTFVHHEFKINSAWELKTIELNWRIWGWRLEIMNFSYWINIYEYIFESWNENINFIENVAAVNVYSPERWILEWYNKELFSEIEKRKSIYNIRIHNNCIWKEVWLTKDWFTSLATIKIKNKNIEEFNKDLKYVEDNYKNLLILKKD